MDTTRPRPESSSSGEGQNIAQHASGAGPLTERSTNASTRSPPSQGPSSSTTVPQLPSSLPSVPSQTLQQLQQYSDPPPSSPRPHHTPAPHQIQSPNTDISTLTAAAMQASASAVVRPPVPIEPPTNTTLAELDGAGGETFRRFQQTSYWDPQASLQHLNMSMARIQQYRTQLTESMEGFDRARSATAAHERMMMSTGDRIVPTSSVSGSRSAVDEAYDVIRERLGASASFPAVRARTRGPEIMLVPPRSPQGVAGGPADDDDGVTLRGRRVMANQALASSARQTDPLQFQAQGDRLQIVWHSINGSLASLQSRQLPAPFAETTPLLTRDLPSPSATPPTVVRVSTPTTVEGSYRGDSTSPGPSHPPVQPFTIIERTPSPSPPLAHPYSLPNIRHIFDHTGATVGVAVHSLSSREPSPVPPTIPTRGRQPDDHYQPFIGQPHAVRRRLDDSGRSIGVSRYSASPPLTPQPYIYDPDISETDIRLRPRSPTPFSEDAFPMNSWDTLPTGGWEVVYPPSFYPTPQPGPETTGFVPPGITDSALPTPRPFNPSPTRPVRRAWRREDSNGDEIISDDEETAEEQRQRELRRRSRLMSHSTTNLNDPIESLALLSRVDTENSVGPRPGDDAADQEKHISEDIVMSGTQVSSARNSRPGSRGSCRSFDLNFTGAGEGEVPIWPCPLPVAPSAMVSRPSPVAKEWRTRITPLIPLHGSVAKARAAAHSKGTRRAGRRYGDLIGR